MKNLVRRSGVFAVAPIWALVWASPGGALELLSNIGINFPISSMFDIWPAVLGIPGAVGSVLFCAGLWNAAGERRLDEWSLPRLGSVGGFIGLLLGVFALLMGLGDHAYPAMWPRGLVTVALGTFLGIAAAVITAVVFRYAAHDEASMVAGARG